jgi:hypothetical protein
MKTALSQSLGGGAQPESPQAASTPAVRRTSPPTPTPASKPLTTRVRLAIGKADVNETKVVLRELLDLPAESAEPKQLSRELMDAFAGDGDIHELVLAVIEKFRLASASGYKSLARGCTIRPDLAPRVCHAIDLVDGDTGLNRIAVELLSAVDNAETGKRVLDVMIHHVGYAGVLAAASATPEGSWLAVPRTLASTESVAIAYLLRVLSSDSDIGSSPAGGKARDIAAKECESAGRLSRHCAAALVYARNITFLARGLRNRPQGSRELVRAAEAFADLYDADNDSEWPLRHCFEAHFGSGKVGGITQILWASLGLPENANVSDGFRKSAGARLHRTIAMGGPVAEDWRRVGMIALETFPDNAGDAIAGFFAAEATLTSPSPHALDAIMAVAQVRHLPTIAATVSDLADVLQPVAAGPLIRCCIRLGAESAPLASVMLKVFGSRLDRLTADERTLLAEALSGIGAKLIDVAIETGWQGDLYGELLYSAIAKVTADIGLKKIEAIVSTFPADKPVSDAALDAVYRAMNKICGDGAALMASACVHDRNATDPVRAGGYFLWRACGRHAPWPVPPPPNGIPVSARVQLAFLFALTRSQPWGDDDASRVNMRRDATVAAVDAWAATNLSDALQAYGSAAFTERIDVVIRHALGDDDAIATSARAALTRYGDKGTRAHQQLGALVRSGSASTRDRERAAIALREIGPAAASTLKDLEVAVASKSANLVRLRELAKEAIDAISAKAATPAE